MFLSHNALFVKVCNRFLINDDLRREIDNMVDANAEIDGVLLKIRQLPLLSRLPALEYLRQKALKEEK
jgi:hypothetical protein